MAASKDDDDADDADNDPYEIRGFVHEPDQTGMAHTVAGLRTAADDEYDAGLVDEDGNSTAIEIGSAEDRAMELQALRDGWATERGQAKPSLTKDTPSAKAAATAPTCPAGADRGPAAWDGLDERTRASLHKPSFDVISYDPDARRRFVRAGSDRYAEGSRLPSGSTLVSIGPSTLTLDYGGCRIALSHADASR